MHEPGTGYDAIVVGAGRRGLAIANDLAERHGLTDVAVLDRRAELNEVGWAHAAVEVIPDCEFTQIL